MKITAARRQLLERGKEMQHAGGFYTADYRQWQRCETLRSADLLKFWNGKRCMFWRAQFYDITEAGRTALSASSRDRA